jgi:hypothetical protein
MAARLAVVFGLVGCFCWLSAAGGTPRDEEERDRALEAQMRGSINRGVAFLRRTQSPDGWWYHRGPGLEQEVLEQNVGATALCALALLFCGVDANDDAIQSAVEVVLSRAPGLTYTYALSLSIVLLDRVNRGQHDALLKRLGERLVAGQGQNTWGWGYYVHNQAGGEDNSNTQLAMLGTFIARKYGVDTSRAFKGLEHRFRTTQHPGSGWGYKPGTGGPLNAVSPAMTCAGLLALAFNYHVERNAVFQGANTEEDFSDPQRIESLRKLRDPRDDPQVRDALLFIRQIMVNNVTTDHFAYFLWTLERTCLVYEWKKIHGINWHYWGARLLIPLQQQNGSWTGDINSGPNAETAFALLYLSKADLIGSLFDFAILRGGSLKEAGRKTTKPADKPRVAQPKAQPGREAVPGEAVALQEELRTAVGDRVDEILDLLEKTKGSDYTNALVNALGFVRGEIKPRVRDALSRRFARMSAKTLRSYLQHEQAEFRRAAAQATALKKEKELIPDLIHTLRDADTEVSEEAAKTLKLLTGRNFGRDAKAWDRWWQEQNK